MERFCHINAYHLKVSYTFSKFNHTVNQNTKSLTMTPTSFLKETCYYLFVYNCLAKPIKLVVWRYHSITWTNVVSSSMMPCGIRLRTISLTMLKIPVIKYVAILHIWNRCHISQGTLNYWKGWQQSRTKYHACISLKCACWIMHFEIQFIYHEQYIYNTKGWCTVWDNLSWSGTDRRLQRLDKFMYEPNDVCY